MQITQSKKYVLSALLIASLSGCSHNDVITKAKDFMQISPDTKETIIVDNETEITIKENKPVHRYLSLPYVQDTHYWNVLAKDVSQQIAEKMANKDVYVEKLTHENSTPFNVAFRNMLIAHLYENNVNVSKTKRIERDVPLNLRLRKMLEDESTKNAYLELREQDQPNILEFNAQIINHKDYTIPDNTSLSALDGTSDVVRAESPGIGTNTVPEALASGPVTEVIVTTTIYNNGILQNATANVYYIPEVSLEHYKKKGGKYMNVVTQ